MNPSPPTNHTPYLPHPQHSHGAEYATSAAETAAAALSQHVPTPNNNHNGSRKRRASGAPGSRGVANLTPEQLAKKRANDREAQRAIRERTRSTIDGLERRIRELESQQPFQELQRVAAERDAARAECEELKRRLATVASVIGGTGNQQPQQQQQQQQADVIGNLHELAALGAQQSPLPISSPQVQQGQYATAMIGPGYEPHQQQQQHIHPDLRSMDGSPASHTPVGAGYQNDGMSTTPSNEQTYPPRLPQPTNGNGNGAGERLGLDYVLEPKQHSPTIYAQEQQQAPLYSRLPHNCPPTCPLDSLLLDFLAGQRRKLESGMSIAEVAGPDYPSFHALQHPSSPGLSNNPITTLLLDILPKFPDISTLPNRVAVLYIMFLILRWQICPCEGCYNRIPEWIRPSPEQLTPETEAGHAAWIDHVPWPVIRRNLISQAKAGHGVDFENFFIPFTHRLSVNWPYAEDHVLLSDDGDSGDVKMNPVFESHLRDLGNWSLGSMFADKFPGLVGDGVRIVG